MANSMKERYEGAQNTGEGWQTSKIAMLETDKELHSVYAAEWGCQQLACYQ